VPRILLLKIFPGSTNGSVNTIGTLHLMGHVWVVTKILAVLVFVYVHRLVFHAIFESVTFEPSAALRLLLLLPSTLACAWISFFRIFVIREGQTLLNVPHEIVNFLDRLSALSRSLRLFIVIAVII
jgi:hypothetical protein